jgi:hypothetical protein
MSDERDQVQSDQVVDQVVSQTGTGEPDFEAHQVGSESIEPDEGENEEGADFELHQTGTGQVVDQLQP